MDFDLTRPELVLPGTRSAGRVMPVRAVKPGPDGWEEIETEGVGRVVLVTRVQPGPHAVELHAAQLAEQQDGPVSRSQLLHLGLSRSQISRWLSCGRLVQIYRGVYSYGHKRLRLEGWLRAALLACGLDAALSHRTGGGWLRLRAGFPATPHLSGPRTGRAGPPRIVFHRPRLLLADDVIIHEGLPVTTVGRTLLDLAAIETGEKLRQAVGAAQRHGIFDAASVAGVIERNRGHRGGKPLAAILDGFRPQLDLREELERRFHRLMERAPDLPPYRPNHPFGPYLLDAFFEDQKVAVELDGYGTHHDVATFVSDRQRDRYLLLHGIRNVRFTWWDVDEAPSMLRGLLLG